MESTVANHSSHSPQFQTTHSRWQALTHRAPSSHFSFLYGVRSTRIYCRPTCTARLARRANIIFYDTEDQARKDGFRPCKRCKPDDSSFLGDQYELSTRVLELLRERKDDPTMERSLKALASQVDVSPSYLCRTFKKTMGMTLGTYMKEFEMTPPSIHARPAASAQSESSPESTIVSSGPATPALLSVDTAPSPDERYQDWPNEKILGVSNESLDLDFDFHFDFESFDEYLHS